MPIPLLTILPLDYFMVQSIRTAVWKRGAAAAAGCFFGLGILDGKISDPGETSQIIFPRA
jgi:hypothetical protein